MVEKLRQLEEPLVEVGGKDFEQRAYLVNYLTVELLLLVVLGLQVYGCKQRGGSLLRVFLLTHLKN